MPWHCCARFLMLCTTVSGQSPDVCKEEIIQAIVAWINGGNDQPMCWLHGAAGFGKSAISRTIAELFAGSSRLGASFFFLRGAGRRSKITHFIPTLAYNLAFSVPATRPHIQNALQRDHIVNRSLEHQFQKLIVEPIRSATNPPGSLPVVIIVDALDECDDKTMIAEVIEIIACAFRNYQLPLRFLFTSRVEEHIRRKFSTSPVLPATYCLSLHSFNADPDLHTFFQSRFSIIYEENRRLMRNIALPWPSASDLRELIRKASGSFIFAFTLLNFVNDGSDLPHRKLQVALGSHAGLDPLYTQVLEAPSLSPHFHQIFGTIMTATEHLSVEDLACLFQIEPADVVHSLLGVQSILVVPEDDEQPIRPFHTSLRDFLTTKTRSNHLFINPSIRHLSIATNCLVTMTANYDDIFFERGGLKFAARSWCHHLLSALTEESGDSLFSQDSTLTIAILTNFVSRSFDSWINSIIVQGKFQHTLQTLDSVVVELRESYQCLANIALMIGKIKTIAESLQQRFKFQEKCFRHDNNLGHDDYGRGYYDQRGYRVGFWLLIGTCYVPIVLL